MSLILLLVAIAGILFNPRYRMAPWARVVTAVLFVAILFYGPKLWQAAPPWVSLSVLALLAIATVAPLIWVRSRLRRVTALMAESEAARAQSEAALARLAALQAQANPDREAHGRRGLSESAARAVEEQQKRWH